MLKQRNQSGTGQKTSIVEVLMTPEISMLIVLVILCVYTNIINPAFFAVKTSELFCETARLSAHWQSVKPLH